MSLREALKMVNVKNDLMHRMDDTSKGVMITRESARLICNFLQNWEDNLKDVEIE